MAQQYTISKNIKLSLTSIVTKFGPPYTDPDSPHTYIQSYGNATKDTRDGKFNFSEIPENAIVISVNVSINSTGDPAGIGGSEFLSTLDAGQTNIGVFSRDVIFEYLNTGAREFYGRASYQRGLAYRIASSPSLFPETVSLTRTFTFTVTVTYEVANATTINYGTKEGFVPCSIHYCDNGTYKPCRAFYGANGEWIELG